MKSFKHEDKHKIKDGFYLSGISLDAFVIRIESLIKYKSYYENSTDFCYRIKNLYGDDLYGDDIALYGWISQAIHDLPVGEFKAMLFYSGHCDEIDEYDNVLHIDLKDNFTRWTHEIYLLSEATNDHNS